MAVPPLLLAKGAANASTALKGDIFTRTTSKVIGKGKNAHVVEDTYHINPVTAVVGLVGLGIGTVGALWAGSKAIKSTGHRVVLGDKTAIRVVRLYDSVFEDVTVVDSPAWDEEIRDYTLVKNAVAPIIPEGTVIEGGGGGGGVPRYI